MKSITKSCCNWDISIHKNVPCSFSRPASRRRFLPSLGGACPPLLRSISVGKRAPASRQEVHRSADRVGSGARCPARHVQQGLGARTLAQPGCQGRVTPGESPPRGELGANAPSGGASALTFETCCKPASPLFLLRDTS